MNTDYHDVFGSLSAQDWITDVGDINLKSIESYLKFQWDIMYSKDPEAIKPTDEVFLFWAIQVKKELEE